MNNVIRLYPTKDYNAMDKLELLDAFAQWSEEPGIDGHETPEWKKRGLPLLRSVYGSAQTTELRTLCKRIYQKIVSDERHFHKK